MLVRDEDLSAPARIRNAALAGFARNGVAATSIRDVARAAGVSAGLVQHHYGTKDALRRAVNDYVVRVGAEALAGLGESTSGDDLVAEIGNRITGLMRDHHDALLYVVRSAAEGDPGALEIFDSFVAVADAQIARLEREGLLRPGLDRRWAALNVVVINLGTALLASAIDRHIDAPLLTPAQLQRWNVASTELFRSGLFRTSDDTH